MNESSCLMPKADPGQATNSSSLRPFRSGDNFFRSTAWARSRVGNLHCDSGGGGGTDARSDQTQLDSSPWSTHLLVDPSPPCRPRSRSTSLTSERRCFQQRPDTSHAMRTQRPPSPRGNFSRRARWSRRRGGRSRRMLSCATRRLLVACALLASSSACGAADGRRSSRRCGQPGPAWLAWRSRSY